MTKSEVQQFLTQGTKNAHCTTCAFIPNAGFSQIRSLFISHDAPASHVRMHAFDIELHPWPCYFFFLVSMPLLVSTKIVSRQDLSTKLLRDWKIVSISDEIAVHLVYSTESRITDLMNMNLLR